MTEIVFRGLEKRFHGLVVVRPLDLTIPHGAFFTFLGPSGCGKSTLLHMIAGLEPVSGGTIAFDGRVINDLSPGERDVAMVFQSYALYPHMSVYENLAFPLRVRKMDRRVIEGEVRRVAHMLGLEALLGRRPRALSGGQRQRVALGRAIIRRPEVFLMDEPLSNLDALLRLEMRAELKRLHQEHPVTTVYVTHDQEEAMVLSDLIAVFHQGIVQQMGPPLEVYARPANLFVAGFIGSPPMNFLEGEAAWRVFSPLFKGLPPGDWVFGIRPVDIEVSHRPDGLSLPGEVILLEPTGSEIWVDGRWEGMLLKGRARKDERMRTGEGVFFHFSLSDVHVFAKESGKRWDLSTAS